MSDDVAAWLLSPEGEQWSRERSVADLPVICRTCRDTGVVQVPDGDGLSEQACPDEVHGDEGLMP